MVGYNRRVARHEGTTLQSLVHQLASTPMRAVTASIIARLLDGDSFDDDGVRWVKHGSAGNELWVDNFPSAGYENYTNVQASTDSLVRLNQAQRNHTLSVKRGSIDCWFTKRDELHKAGIGLGIPGFDLEAFAQQRLGAAFVIAYVFLVEEMQRELGDGFILEDSHMPDSACPEAAFGWHIDDHLESDSPPGPQLSRTVVCQCSAGRASAGIAGAGEISYLGVGSFVCFPASFLHRTLLVRPEQEGRSMWKLTGFFSRKH
jgi:hypothetical protein